VIGAAGGTVTGPSGASVVIPAGALASDTRILIEVVTAGAPALPTSFTATGQMFAFTPHGTTFAVPVTITLPLDPTLIPAGQTPVLYKTDSLNQWTEVTEATVGANSISGQVTSFSDVVNGLLRDDPKRNWYFSIIPSNGAEWIPVPPAERTAQIGQLVEQTAYFGPAPLDDVFDEVPPAVFNNTAANGWVMSTPNGSTYEVYADSSDGRRGSPNGVGGLTKFKQSQSYIKRASNASLSYTVTKIIVNAVDLSPTMTDRDWTLQAVVDLSAEAHLSLNPKEVLHSRGGLAGIRGTGDYWFPVYGDVEGFGAVLWKQKDFTLTTEPYVYLLPGGRDCHGTRAIFTLTKPLTFPVRISQLDIGEEFTLEIETNAAAENDRGGLSLGDCEGGFINAMLRDPVGFGGASVEYIGLEPTNRPVPRIAEAPPVQPVACASGSVPDPAAGVLEFSAATYHTNERGLGPAVAVTRSGGSTGDVSVTFATSDGTAIAGNDYTAVNRTMLFADGEDGPRFVNIAMLLDELSEPDETLNVTLSQPGGCAALGAQTTAVLTIFDDDILPSFTIGGTVTGLVGTGLTLQDHHFDTLTPEDDGPFTFRLPTQSGSPYEVTITAQPSNPVQVCSVSNGSGTVGNGNVTNVEVRCGLPPPPGGLDPGFGGGTGKVSTDFGGDETDMLLQNDEGEIKILMVGGASSSFVMARFNSDGSPDQTFGVNGRVTTDIAVGTDAAFAAALTGDGHIIVVGSARVGSSDDFAIVRYSGDGTLDTTFGNQGKVTTDFFGQRDRAFAVAIQPDDRIVVVGDATTSSGNSDFAVARYEANGALDTSFGSAGKVTTNIERVDIAKNVVIESGGTILVTGSTTLGTSPVLGHTGLARYNGSGELVSSFGIDGIVSIANLALGDGLAVQGDGRILVAGNAVVAGQTQFGVMRLESNGAPDLGFGTNGLATAGFTTQVDYSRDVVIDSAGRILLSGQASNTVHPDFAVARLLPNGTLDGSFSDDGRFSVDFFDASDGAENIAVQPDGKIVLGGFAQNGATVQYALARINP